MRQWVRINMFLIVSAIANNFNGNSTLVDQPSQIIGSLAKHWAPFLDGSRDLFHSDVAHEVLSSLSDHGRWDWSSVRLQFFPQFSQIIANSSDSAPGFDGIPYFGHHSECALSALLRMIFFENFVVLTLMIPPPNV